MAKKVSKRKEKEKEQQVALIFGALHFIVWGMAHTAMLLLTVIFAILLMTHPSFGWKWPFFLLMMFFGIVWEVMAAIHYSGDCDDCDDDDTDDKSDDEKDK